MSNRSRQRGGNIFENRSAPTHKTLQEVDSEIFGAIAGVDEGFASIEPLSIFEIIPDFAQPRRTVPSVVRVQWDKSPDTVINMLQAWIQLASEERSRPLVVEEFFQEATGPEKGADPEAETPHEMTNKGPIEESLVKVIQLAATIYRDGGLAHAIRVVRMGRFYRIEIGERRWLAYHLLYGLFQDEKWSKIQACEVKERSVWRQAHENNARAI